MEKTIQEGWNAKRILEMLDVKQDALLSNWVMTGTRRKCLYWKVEERLNCSNK